MGAVDVEIAATGIGGGLCIGTCFEFFINNQIPTPIIKRVADARRKTFFVMAYYGTTTTESDPLNPWPLSKNPFTVAFTLDEVNCSASVRK